MNYFYYSPEKGVFPIPSFTLLEAPRARKVGRFICKAFKTTSPFIVVGNDLRAYTCRTEKAVLGGGEMEGQCGPVEIDMQTFAQWVVKHMQDHQKPQLAGS